MGWGTQLAVKLNGIPIGTSCQLWVIGPGGRRTLAGGWVTDDHEGAVCYPGSAGVPAGRRGFQARLPDPGRSPCRPEPRPMPAGEKAGREARDGPAIPARTVCAAMSVIGGLIVLVVVLAAASAAGFRLRARSGRFQARRSTPSQLERTPATPHRRPAAGTVLTAADLGAPLGQRATLVEFRPTSAPTAVRPGNSWPRWRGNGPASPSWRSTQPTGWTWPDGCVMSTPTVLVLGAAGAIERRSSGQQRRPDLLAAVGAVLGEGGDS